MILRDPATVRNPFYEMAPSWGIYPLIALATVATVIASQALITAAFSVTKQVVQLGYLPRLRIVHTSESETGQVYVPFINWSLYAGVVVAVTFFGSSTRLAGAYGITVTIDMFITTIMTFFVIRYAWKYPWYLVIGATGFFFLVDLALMSANLVKILDGGWFPLLIGGFMFTLMMTWNQGRGLMSTSLREDALDLKSFLESVFISPPTRVAGTAVFLVVDQGLTPNALLHNLKHNKVLHERNLFVTVRHHEVPWIEPGRAQRDRAARQRLLAGDAQLRLQGRARRACRSRGPALARLLGRRHGHVVLPLPRHRHPHLRRRHGRLAREALCRHAPQRLGRRRLPAPAHQSRRRARLQGRDLIARTRRSRLPCNFSSSPTRSKASRRARTRASR
jgi:K+ transporter